MNQATIATTVTNSVNFAAALICEGAHALSIFSLTAFA
jgi:hypothetical protein